MEVNDKVKDETICVEQSGTQQIHVRGNSDSELQALFDCVLKPSSQMPLQKPFKMRNLPKSFFTPPAHRQSPAPTVSHSREGSADSTYGSGGTGPIRVGGAVSPSPPQGAQHFRHHSSPASLQQTLSIAQPPSVHAKQHSYDALADEAQNLPQGWEQARTPQGQIYYLNHLTQSTQWEDPRKKLQSLAPHLQPPASPQPSQSQPPAASPAISLQPIIAPSQLSSPASSTPAPSPTPPPSVTSSGANTTTGRPTGSGTGTTVHRLINPNPGQLPSGWEQGISPDGEIYFINHHTKTTSWFDPRIPKEHQTSAANKAANNALPHISMTPHGGQTNLQLANTLPPLGPAGLTSSGDMQQRQTLQRLQQEREKLRLRRQEIARTQQVMDFAPRRNVREDVTAATLSDVLPRSMALHSQRSPIPSTLPSLVPSSSAVELSFTSADPFMASTDFHSRQESADSGLGLGNNYTQPHTPEDFLSAMEDDIIPSQELKQNAASPMIVPELESMDSDDLVPSITLNDDFLKEMLDEPAKLENLQTWL